MYEHHLDRKDTCCHTLQLQALPPISAGSLLTRAFDAPTPQCMAGRVARALPNTQSKPMDFGQPYREFKSVFAIAARPMKHSKTSQPRNVAVARWTKSSPPATSQRRNRKSADVQMTRVTAHALAPIASHAFLSCEAPNRTPQNPYVFPKKGRV
ncbi:hypothetical protein [Aliiroseovarius halocynthiae]|nr:hypothetical protein [Aliiroseovarius halocynthiae]